MECELSFLAPDVATLIRQGDGLILTVHDSDPVRAERLKEYSQDKLRTKWQEVKAVCEVSQQYKYRLLSFDILTFTTGNKNCNKDLKTIMCTMLFLMKNLGVFYTYSCNTNFRTLFYR